MKINLNNAEDITVENVAQLLASKDDSKYRQIRVTEDGIAFLSDDVGSRNLDKIVFRMETLFAGNGYVGMGASKDDLWVGRVTKCLQDKGLGNSGSYCDDF